jgi:peptide/nickel transport system permease protein
VVRRVALAVPLVFVVSTLTFILLALTPSDAAKQILGLRATPAAYARLRHALGTDKPLYAQYWHWLTHAMRGDLGTSIGGTNVASQIGGRVPITLSLMAGGLLLSVTIGVCLGMLGAVRGGTLDRGLAVFTMFGWAVPSFWIGAELIVIFAVNVRWFPVGGYTPFSDSPSAWLRSITLPSIALAIGGIAGVAKMTREAMVDALNSEYVRMLWANGVRARSIYFRHALKNAAPTVVTMIGLLAIGLLGGTVFAETVFALPGVGSLLVSSVAGHDYPIVEGIVVFLTLAVSLLSLLIDLSYAWLNPKVRRK